MTMIEFPHTAPEGYSYEFEEFKRNVTAIWLRDNRIFDYNLGKSVRTIWGFYHSKTKTYSAPVNAKTVGKSVDIEDTTPYTAMQIIHKGVERYFV